MKNQELKALMIRPTQLGQYQDSVNRLIASDSYIIHPRTFDLIVGVPHRKQHRANSRCLAGYPRISYHRMSNRKISCIFTIADSGVYFTNLRLGKPTSQYKDVYIATPRRRIIGGHSFFDSNPNRVVGSTCIQPRPTREQESSREKVEMWNKVGYVL